MALTASKSMDEWMVLGLILSIFLSVYATAVGMIIVLVYLARQRRMIQIMDALPGAYYLVAFCLLTLIVSLFNQNGRGILTAIVLLAFFIVSMYIRTVMTPKLFDMVVFVSCAASLISVVVIIIQRLNKFGLVNKGTTDYRVSSTFSNANYYAAVIEFVILFCVCNLIKPNQRYRLFYVVVLFMNLFGLYLSECRTAILAVGIAVLVLLWLNRQYSVLGLVLLAGVFVVTVNNGIINFLPHISVSETDLLNRVFIWNTAFKGILLNPLFGQGGGTYLRIFARFGGPDVPHAHSLFLDPVLNFGIIGMTLLVIYLKKNFRAIYQLKNIGNERSYKNLVTAALLCVFIHGITDLTIFSLEPALIFFLILSVAGIGERAQLPVAHRQPNTHQQPSPVWTEQLLPLQVVKKAGNGKLL